MIPDTLSPPVEWKSRPLATTATQPLSVIMPSWKDSEAESASPHSDLAATIHRPSTGSPPAVRQFRAQREEATLLEKWDGFVLSILPDGFRAEMRRNRSDFEALVAEFDFSELSEDDQAILSEGMPLVWAITRERRNGGVKRCSVLYLRRQPRASPEEHGAALELLNNLDHD